MRLFVAVELPEATVLLLQEEILCLRQAGGRASWVRPEHMHLTLRFLGEVNEEQKTIFSMRLRDLCAGTPAFRLTVEGFGAFPNQHRPAVLWAGVREVTGKLAGLQREIEQTAQSIGLDPDGKPFHPHVTLARIRELSGAAGLVEAVKNRAGRAPVSFGDEFRAEAVALLRSDLKPGGPVHARLEEFPLSCNSCL